MLSNAHVVIIAHQQKIPLPVNPGERRKKVMTNDPSPLQPRGEEDEEVKRRPQSRTPQPRVRRSDECAGLRKMRDSCTTNERARMKCSCEEPHPTTPGAARIGSERAHENRESRAQ